ncbi:hypothetical protein [Sphingomonas glacialis]|uniref:hypothetical protein n=1 Tax=Sphingomonas glacialis TaxID=658225 RepID=UPI001F4FAB47|nr:hypothetical protein [Sphingomonas glacialis]
MFVGIAVQNQATGTLVVEPIDPEFAISNWQIPSQQITEYTASWGKRSAQRPIVSGSQR